MTLSSSDKNNKNYPPSSQPQAKGLMLRISLIALLSLLMMIPLFMIGNIVDERHQYYKDVMADIASLWGQEQTVAGPILLIPYVEKHISRQRETNNSGAGQLLEKETFIKKVAVILPETLLITADLEEQFRKRGIYKSLVYRADTSLSGKFNIPDFSTLSEHLDHIDWQKSHIIMGLQDTSAIRHLSALKWSASEIEFKPGIVYHDIFKTGFHAPVAIDPNSKDFSFSYTLSFNGSGLFNFIPVGKKTTVNLTSKWPHPSFQGRMLPSNHTITSDGFSASWEVPFLSRNLPQYWILGSRSDRIDDYGIGVRLFEPVFLYSQVTRAVKYGILFIGLTFIALFSFELILKTRLHYIQYGLVGIAMTLFYLILLSFAEHIGFLGAYITAAASCSILISLYIKTALRDFLKGVLMFGILSALYALLYSLLQLEDYALLSGTVLVMALVVMLMYFTRNLQDSTA